MKPKCQPCREGRHFKCAIVGCYCTHEPEPDIMADDDFWDGVGEAALLSGGALRHLFRDICNEGWQNPGRN